MKREEYNLLKEIVIWIASIAVIFLAIYVVIFINKESYSCMNNPYNYTINLLQKSNDAKVSCLCTVYKSPPISVILDENGFKPTGSSSTSINNSQIFSIKVVD